MKRTRRIVASVAALPLLVTLTACGSSQKTTEIKDASADYGLTASGDPIVEKTLTLNFGGSKSALAPDYASMQLVQEWQDSTNIVIDWTNLAEQVYQEKKNLLLASGDMPDALFNSGLSDSEIVDYGSNGTLIPLEQLINDHAPNLKALLDERPDIRAAITASDGHIYSLPSVEELGILPFPNFLYINKAWLDKLGLPVPTTIDEYRAALEAFKTQDPNGNGKADEIPLSFRPDSFCANPWDLVTALGGQPENNDHRIVVNGKVQFTANTTEYKTGVKKLGEWYADGLIDPEAFSQDDTAYLAKGKSDTAILGSFYWWELKEMVGEDRAGDYVLLGVLKGQDGTQRASVTNNQEISRGAMVLTRSNKYPVATIRWADRLYDPVMSAQTAWGPIGVTLQKDETSGLLVQIPAAEGQSEGERRQLVAPQGPRATTKKDFETVIAPEPRAKERQDLVEQYYRPFAANDTYPPVLLSNEELDKVSYPLTDINTLVKEKFATWIVNGNIEKEWDSYTSQLDTLGVSEVTSVYQEAYERFASIDK